MVFEHEREYSSQSGCDDIDSSQDRLHSGDRCPQVGRDRRKGIRGVEPGLTTDERLSV